jgi:hypothetical protein
MLRRTVLVVLILTLFLPYTASADTLPRIRILDGPLKALFDHGVTQSPTLSALVEKVEASSILVFVEGDMRMPERLGARLTFVTSINGVRYVRVDINCMLAQRRQVALLAHELQHALEIAERPDIVDVEAMESMYEDIGFQSFENGRHRGFETDEALEVQEMVDRELGARTRPQGHATY